MTAYLLLGGSGFIGTNLALKLAQRPGAGVKVACRRPEKARNLASCETIELVSSEFNRMSDFSSLVRGIDVVVHMVSTTNPSSSNRSITCELEDVPATAKFLDACIAAAVKRVVFISSGGTVYGKGQPPFAEDDPVWPICSYGLQKVAIEKLLHLYGHLYGLDYRIVRPSNPYGPYQNALNGQGVIAAFVASALAGDDLVVFGDGSVVRDFMYIDDVVEGLVKIIDHAGPSRVFNLGSGSGSKIVDIARTVQFLTGSRSRIRFEEGRGVDVPESVLDMSRFEAELGALHTTGIELGIIKTIDYQQALLKGHA